MDFNDRKKQFLTGRYGPDSFNTALSILSLLMLTAALIVTAASRSAAAWIVGGALFALAACSVGFAMFRMFSRNLTARRKEYEFFRRVFVTPFSRKKNELNTRRTQSATHRFFKCPGCRQTVRVPKGKGKIRITCPKCGRIFERKS